MAEKVSLVVLDILLQFTKCWYSGICLKALPFLEDETKDLEIRLKF